MTAHSSLRSASVWLFACLGLGALVALELAGELPVASEVTAAAPARVDLEPIAEPPGFQPPPADQVRIIAARPLFAATRRPFVPAVAEPDASAPAEEAPTATLELIGVLVTERQRSVLVQPVGSDQSSWVREGETIAGWRIESVDSDQVTLQRGPQLETVELRADTSVPPAPRADRNRRTTGKSAKDDEAAAPDEAAATKDEGTD